MSEKGIRELEFTVFCIEGLAERLKIEPWDAYDMLAKKTNLLHEYVIPGYDVLHTQDKEYIVNDLIEALKLKGIAVA